MGSVPEQGFDPAALLLIVLVAGIGIGIGIVALRRRPKTPRWMNLRRTRRKLDVIRRDLDRMVEYVGELRDSEPTAHQLFELGLAAMTRCHWNQAVEHFQEARQRATRAQLVPLLVHIGVCHYMQGSLDDALQEFGEASRQADRERDKLGAAAALADIGVVHHEYGELGSALTYLNEALGIFRELDDQPDVALCLNNIGNVHHSNGKLDDALKSHEDALAISRGLSDELGIVTGLGNTASVRHDKGELDKALELYAEVIEKARKIGDNVGYVIELGSIGSVYYDKGDFDRALRFHEDSLAGARRIGFRLAVATELGNIGLVLEKRGAHGQAVPNLAEALSILLSIGASGGQLQVLLGMSRCDDGLGRERMQELLKEALGSEEGATDVLERVDQLRRRRPWPTAKN
ncbi:tetratricopeptide repeat protein [candidate division WOR-3 bacterium]|nr:tetratricopeptide repeat protein [candidate division WOR-3 bacterium]